MAADNFDKAVAFLQGFDWDVSDQDTDTYVIGDQDGDRFYFGTAIMTIPRGGVRPEIITEIVKSADEMVRHCEAFDWEGVPGIDRTIEGVSVLEFPEHIEIHVDWESQHDYAADAEEAAHDRAEWEREIARL